MASKVCVFDDAISSRSVLIDQMLRVSFLAMMLPPDTFNCRSGQLSFVLCQGAVTANKWRWMSAEERPLSRRQSSRPSGARLVSFARRRSTAAAPVLKGSFGFRPWSDLDQVDYFGPKQDAQLAT
jgi:hypothetical protein